MNLLRNLIWRSKIYPKKLYVYPDQFLAIGTYYFPNITVSNGNTIVVTYHTLTGVKKQCTVIRIEEPKTQKSFAPKPLPVRSRFSLWLADIKAQFRR